ncbi:PQQ-dependent sugar dehydrogenase [Vibrio makurazakiensis]|uniref:PQQ-dependent sugar dehydrogenase n=1 Tax=Vibrio makurazakiensis TaxID=2910250 RepID=UPI003D114CFA
MNKTILFTLLLASFTSFGNEYSLTKVASNLELPWGLQFTNEKTLLVTEKTGSVVELDIPTGNKNILLTIKDLSSKGQGGLMDIAVSPINSNQLYFSYSKPVTNGVATTLATANYNDGKLTQWRDVLVTSAASDTSRHFGSRIAFDSDNHLYLTLGDKGDRDNGQDTSNHAASILRLNLDGSVPSDNPFIKDTNYASEIWSFGHRNPQGITFDLESNTMWAIEHGPRGGDEINRIKRGKNYGWPITSHGKEYWGPISVGEAEEKEGIESPALVYVPSIAPSSLVLYRGEVYPNLNGKLLAGALKLTHINVISIDDQLALKEERRLFEDLNERIRDITISPGGHIYFCTDNGNIYRIEPKILES